MFDLSITYERLKDHMIDFGSTYTITGYTFVTSLPNNSRNSSFIHKVFEPYVWLSSIFTMLLFYTVLKVISKLSSSEFRFWTLLEILFMQNFNKKAFKYKNIVMFLFLWLYFSFLLTMFYSNCIYSFMIKPAKVKTVDTIDQLIDAINQDELAIYSLKSTFEYLGVSIHFYNPSTRQWE